MKRICILFKDKVNDSNVNNLHMMASDSQASFLHQVLAGNFSRKYLNRNWIANCAWIWADEEDINRLHGMDYVEAIYQNTEIQLDIPLNQEHDSGKWRDDHISTWGLKSIRAIEARQLTGMSGKGIKVGILDTGIGSHPDLSGKIDSGDWKDFTHRGEESPYDGNGHGTHCAGTICGNPSEGMQIGVAPDAKLVVGKILSDRGSGQAEWILNGMEWIATRGVSIVSNSWGSAGMTGVFKRAVDNWRKLNILPVFAAGNSGPGSGTVGSPGGYKNSFAIGACTSQDKVAGFSSRGPVDWNGETYVKPDVSAPGASVTSCKPGGGYFTISGTSMATPHVAGLCALVRQANKHMTMSDLQDIIEKCTYKFTNEKSNNWGFGKVDCLASVLAATLR